MKILILYFDYHGCPSYYSSSTTYFYPIGFKEIKQFSLLQSVIYFIHLVQLTNIKDFIYMLTGCMSKLPCFVHNEESIDRSCIIK